MSVTVTHSSLERLQLACWNLLELDNHPGVTEPTPTPSPSSPRYVSPCPTDVVYGGAFDANIKVTFAILDAILSPYMHTVCGPAHYDIIFRRERGRHRVAVSSVSMGIIGAFSTHLGPYPP